MRYPPSLSFRSARSFKLFIGLSIPDRFKCFDRPSTRSRIPNSRESRCSAGDNARQFVYRWLPSECFQYEWTNDAIWPFYGSCGVGRIGIGQAAWSSTLHLPRIRSSNTRQSHDVSRRFSSVLLLLIGTDSSLSNSRRVGIRTANPSSPFRPSVKSPRSQAVGRVRSRTSSLKTLLEPGNCRELFLLLH